jgi:hypothetical protein
VFRSLANLALNKFEIASAADPLNTRFAASVKQVVSCGVLSSPILIDLSAFSTDTWR